MEELSIMLDWINYSSKQFEPRSWAFMQLQLLQEMMNAGYDLTWNGVTFELLDVEDATCKTLVDAYFMSEVIEA